MKKKVGIVGAQGYTGRELVRLLNMHPHANLAGIFTTQEEWDIAYDLPEFAKQNVPHHCVSQLNSHCDIFDVIFLATPPEVSLELAPDLIDNNVTVIDLSAAFRLNAVDFEDVYGIKHTAPPLTKDAVYGLAPWWAKNKAIEGHKLIANPGCYATCALMSLLPLLESEVIQPDNIVIDAKSGVSGAGRTAKKDLLFCEISDNFYPYKVEGHQHIPEIQKHIDSFINTQCLPTMVTHLLPIKRGISISIYADSATCSMTDEMILEAVSNAYGNAYVDYHLIKFGPVKEKFNLENMTLLSLKHVIGSARTHIGYFVKNGKVFIFSSIDNLLKGAASQAVENFNAVSNLPLETGLLNVEGIL